MTPTSGIIQDITWLTHRPDKAFIVKLVGGAYMHLGFGNYPESEFHINGATATYDELRQWYAENKDKMPRATLYPSENHYGVCLRVDVADFNEQPKEQP